MPETTTTITKPKLVEQITSELNAGCAQPDLEDGWSKRDVREVLDALQHVVTQNVRQGHSVSLPGFVKFRVQEKPAQPAKKNVPKPFGAPGETYNRPATPKRRVPKVTLFKAFKDAVT